MGRSDKNQDLGLLYHKKIICIFILLCYYWQKGGGMRVNEHTKAILLNELAKDMDWTSAAKRLGLSRAQLSKIKADERFMQKAEKLFNHVTEAVADVEGTVKRFQQTQQVLMNELNGGNMGVANALIRSHELEFRMHGLFEKDNNQKNAPVQINISLQQVKEPIEVVDAEET